MKTLNSSLFLALIIIISCSRKEVEKESLIYPVSKKVDTVDVYFGTSVPDPYRWLENDSARETAEWVSAQNEVTFGYLKNISFREAVRKRLDEVQNYERISAPQKNGDYYYYSKNSGLQNHNVQYRKKGEEGVEELFLVPC